MIVFAPSTMARPAWIARSACACIVAAALLLAACSGNSRSTVTAPIGTTAGVALSSSTGTTRIQQSSAATPSTMVITASVTVDPNKQGVTWVLNGLGAISNVNSTTVTYTAPTGVTGTTTPVITATSIYDTTQNSAVTLVVLGDPVIDPSTVLFPGNVNTVYGAAVVVSGGLAPYTWALDASSAALPAGITLGTTVTGAFTTLSGTPTTLGTYPFTVDVTDANGKKSTVALSLTINGAEACLLTGQYAVLYSGYDSGQMSVLASSLNIYATGTITGYQDFGSPGTPDAESVTGTCTTRTANNGTLAVTGTGFAPQYDYAVPAICRPAACSCKTAATGSQARA